MRSRGWTKISLATKCRILFGVAVLIILSATLYLPWIRMDGLMKSTDVQRALQLARWARLTSNIDVLNEWTTAIEQMERDWTPTIQALGLPNVMPTLYSVDQEAALHDMAPRGFLLESLRRFRLEPHLEYTQKTQEDLDGTFVRLALAVRTPETDANPNALRGIIHVQIPIPTEIRQWNLIVLALAGLSGCFLAILVFYLVTQYLILSPVRELRQVAERVTGGRADARAQINTGDEFEELAQAFNDMLAHLRASHNELETINHSLDVKLGELAESNVSLYEANKLKSEFIANVSHELRTPLGLIINFTELLRDALDDPPEDRTRLTRYADNILRNGRTLLDIINDLLDLAKIEAGRIELHLTDFSLPDVCAALIDFVQPLADKKNIVLVGPLVENLPPVRTDAGKLKQILYNLLSNAVKFTPEGGTIRLTIGLQGERHVQLAVSDTGPGIAADMFDVIFEKFRQIDSSLTREHSGTGLGLAITKELCHVLGGTIEVSSEVGVGSTFKVTLPLEAPEQAQQKLIPLSG